MVLNFSHAKLQTTSEWIARIVFMIVFLLNVQCALQFVLFPGVFVASFNLTGKPGTVAIQGLGVAFLMWNCTYPAFIAKPNKFKVVGVIILVQQLVGLVGEACIRQGIDASAYAATARSIERFLVYDGIGFLAMTIAFLLLLLAGKLVDRKSHPGAIL